MRSMLLSHEMLDVFLSVKKYKYLADWVTHEKLSIVCLNLFVGGSIQEPDALALRDMTRKKTNLYPYNNRWCNCEARTAHLSLQLELYRQRGWMSTSRDEFGPSAFQVFLACFHEQEYKWPHTFTSLVNGHAQYQLLKSLSLLRG